MKNTFRTAAVGGFNRQDVTDYITKTAEETAETIRLLEQERDEYAAAAAEKDQLAVEAESLKELVSDLEATLAQERSERERLCAENEEKKVLEEKVASLEAQIASLEAQAAEYRELKDHIAQVELEARKRAEDILAQVDSQAKELLAAAKSDAEELLGKANSEAEEARCVLRSQVQSAAADFALLQKDFDVMKNHLTSELRKMDVALSQLPLAFNKVSGELKQLEQKVSE